MSELVGDFPIRQDITVLPADDPKKLRLGWIVYEEVGMICVNDYNKYGYCECCNGSLDPNDPDCCPELLEIYEKENNQWAAVVVE